jgi:hypothetical protein
VQSYEEVGNKKLELSSEALGWRELLLQEIWLIFADFEIISLFRKFWQILATTISLPSFREKNTPRQLRKTPRWSIG